MEKTLRESLGENKMKKTLLVLFLLLVSILPVFSDDIETHEFDDILTELNKEDFLEEVSFIEKLSLEISEYKVNNNYNIRIPNFEQLPDNALLSDRILNIKNIVSKYENFTNELLEISNKKDTKINNILSKMLELQTHYSNLITILQKMTKSQLQDLGIVNEQLGLATQETESLKIRIEANLRLASKMAEEIAVYQKMKKRLRTTAYVELAVGVPCLIMGCLPIWTEEQQNIRDLFLGIGGTATAASGFTFAFTITF